MIPEKHANTHRQHLRGRLEPLGDILDQIETYSHRLRQAVHLILFVDLLAIPDEHRTSATSSRAE